MIRQTLLPLASAMAIASIFASCGEKKAETAAANAAATPTPAATVAALKDVSLNSLPGLDKALAARATTFLAEVVGTPPTFAQLQTDYLTPAAKTGLFQTGNEGHLRCRVINHVARGIAKFLSVDSESCTFKTVSKAIGTKSWISVTKGTIGSEGLFGSATEDKRIKVAASMGNQSIDIYFLIKGNGGSATAKYDLQMVQCPGGQLSSIMKIVVDPVARTMAHTQETSGDEGNRASRFSAKLNATGSDFDLAEERIFEQEEERDGRYDAFKVVVNGDNRATVTNFANVANDATQTQRDIIVAAITGDGALSLGLPQASYKFPTTGTDAVTAASMEFQTDKYVTASVAKLESVRDAVPTTGAMMEVPAGGIAKPYLAAASCGFDSTTHEATLALAEAEADINAACRGILHDSSDSADANGNPFVREGSYCTSVQ